MTRCQACGRGGYVVPVPELRAVLCLSCDQALMDWAVAHPAEPHTNWPRWNDPRR